MDGGLRKARVARYFKQRCRNTGTIFSTFKEVATDLEIDVVTATRYIRRLCDSGRLKRERHKQLGGKFEVPGLGVLRNPYKSASLQAWDLPSTKAVFEELRKKCAAAGGKWSGTHQMLAKGVRFHPGTTISRTGELRTRINHKGTSWILVRLLMISVTPSSITPFSHIRGGQGAQIH